MAVVVQPLDPDSAKGREVAERLNQTLAEIFTELDAKKTAEQMAGTNHREAA